MPFNVRGQVIIPLDSNLPEDATVNVWHFEGNDPDVPNPSRSALTVAQDAHAKLVTFYQAIDGLVFPSEVSSEATVKWYNLDDPEPRVPILTDVIALVNNTNIGLPHEVAVVLSYKADAPSGTNVRRRRGRIFIGPITQDALLLSNSRVLVTAAVQNAINNAANVLRDANDDDSAWQVFSRVTLEEGATVAASSFDVVSGHVDNAFDTQRRRGQESTVRVTFS